MVNMVKHCVLGGVLLLLAMGVEATTAQAKREALTISNTVLDAGADVRDEYAVGLLPVGGTTVYQTTLRKGYRYWIIVGGCNDAYDMDIAVLDENRNVIGVDAGDDKHAVVEVSPAWTGNFYIVIELADGTSNGAHYNLITAYAKE